jgi:hypothetical protein
VNTLTRQLSSNNLTLFLQAYIGDPANPESNRKNPYFVCCILYKSHSANRKLAWIAFVSLPVVAIVVAVIVTVVIKMKQPNEKKDDNGGRTRNGNRLDSIASNNDSVFGSPFANKKSSNATRMATSPNYARHMNSMNFHSVNSFLRGATSNADGENQGGNVPRRSDSDLIEDFDYEVPVTFTDGDSNDIEVALRRRQISLVDRPLSMLPESISPSAGETGTSSDDVDMGDLDVGGAIAEFVLMPTTVLMRNRQIVTVTDKAKPSHPPESSA